MKSVAVHNVIVETRILAHTQMHYHWLLPGERNKRENLHRLQICQSRILEHPESCEYQQEQAIFMTCNSQNSFRADPPDAPSWIA